MRATPFRPDRQEASAPVRRLLARLFRRPRESDALYYLQRYRPGQITPLKLGLSEDEVAEALAAFREKSRTHAK